ncbi:hypothetical protein FRB93_008801 [Tulasnella sp. JGI-2019a]|nr:hypothetical protein FRB93_008801 [Tulasnella sp. JGI-2019a]
MAFTTKKALRWAMIGGYVAFVLLIVTWKFASPPMHHLEPEADDPSQFNVLELLNGPPTNSVHDNLRNDTMYITAFFQAGLTNSLMNAANLIYLAILSDRVAIIPPFDPGNIGRLQDVGVVHFGDIFDIDHFHWKTGVSLLEWRDVKRMPEVSSLAEMDFLGCWTLHATANDRKGRPHGIQLFKYLGLDASYTPVPAHYHLGNQHKSFHGIAALGFPSGRAEGLVLGPQAHDDPTPFLSQHFNKAIPPDERLMCMDTVYYVAGSQPFEWERDYSPAWRFVGKHLKFSERVQWVTEASLRRIWSLTEDEAFPRFIAIHIRRGDFQGHCGGQSLKTCFAPLSIVAEHVDRVRQQLITRSSPWAGASAFRHVLVTSDEQDPLFWAEVRGLGWSAFGWTEANDSDWSPTMFDFRPELLGSRDKWDHKRIVPDSWWPALVDAASQSMASGFVGTADSTMSLLAMRRVREWNSGVGVMVPFGPGMYPDAEVT